MMVVVLVYLRLRVAAEWLKRAELVKQIESAQAKQVANCATNNHWFR